MSRLTATSVSSTSVSDVATHHSKRLMGFEATTFCMAMAKVTREPHPLYAYCGCFAAPGERHPDGK
jgi:hypothetical protein